MARRKPAPPPAEVSPGELPPPELLVGALIEIWAADDEEGEYGPAFPAMRRYRHARRTWAEGLNLSTAEECRRFGGFPSSAWSYSFLVEDGRRAEAEDRLSRAGVAEADLPMLRAAAQAYPPDWITATERRTQ